MPYIIRNGVQYASGLDQTTYEIIGDEPLDIGDNLIDACNQLKQSLSQLPTRYPNITPIQGSSSVTLQCGYGVGKLMGLTCEINVVSVNQNSWVNIGNIAVKPRNTVKVIALRTGNGTHCGMVEIQNTGLVRLYSTQALSNNSITFTVSYEANDLN